MSPAHVDSLKLTDEQKGMVRTWYQSGKEGKMQSGKAEPLLQVEHLTFGYQQGKNTLEDIDFTIYKGEMISIVGRNGAGKSTLAKLICGFELPVSGRILLEGRDLLNDTIRERAEKIGYVMQNPNQMISKPMIWDEVELALLKMGMTEEE